MKPILAQNLSILKKTHADLFHLLNKHVPSIASFTAPNSVSDKDSDCNDEIKKQIQSSMDGGCDFFYFLGIGDGSVLVEISPSIIKDNKGIFIIEPSYELVGEVFAQNDLRSLFRSQRIFWAVGDEIEKKITSVLNDTLCYAAAKPAFFILHPDGNHNDTYESILQAVKSDVNDQKKELTTKVNQIANRLGQSDNTTDRLKVWTFEDLRNKARYSLIEHVLMRTLMFQLRRLGFKAEYTTLMPGCYYPPYFRIIKLVMFKPDIIFLCNSAPAYESALGEELSRSLPIPKVIWFADDPIYGEHLIKRHKTSPEETYLVADYEWEDSLKEQGAEVVHYMPGAATKIRRGKKRGSHHCDIVFVGQVREQSAFFNQLSEAWKHYCRLVVQEKLRYPRKKVREVMNQFPMPGELAEDRLDEFRQKLLWEANTRFRLRVIQALSGYDIRIYGNSDWTTLLPPDITQRCFKGVLRFKRLFDVYRNAKIVLNIHSLQSYTCMNVRDFDVPAAGGFLISDWLPKADEIYHPGFSHDLPLKNDSIQEVFFYRSLIELRTLVDYFLNHEKVRRACIERARHKVLSQHTYAHRAEWLANLFRSLINHSRE